MVVYVVVYVVVEEGWVVVGLYVKGVVGVDSDEFGVFCQQVCDLFLVIEWIVDCGDEQLVRFGDEVFWIFELWIVE